jgi:ankyrin repeat protein
MKYIVLGWFIMMALLPLRAQSAKEAWEMIRKGDTTAISKWLQTGMSVDTGFWQYRTLLHMCVFQNRYPMVTWLFSRQCNLNRQDADGMTPLHWAVSRGDMEMTTLLLARQPNLRLVNARGESLLHLAAIHQNLPLARLLLLAGADKYIRDKFDLQPADYAFDPDLRGLLYTGGK